jgi:glycosyltransferase involved in cell wall biosynthesis
MADPKEAPAVSVIMNCRNCAEHLREAIDSVYAQTFTDWEIIFWDNLSTDEGPGIAKGYDSRLRYFRGTEFLPIGAARSKAIEQATGKYIAFLDTDDIWLPWHLSGHLSMFDEDTLLVYGNFIIRNEITGNETVPFTPHREFHSGRITARLCRKNFIWLQALVVRAEALRALDYDFDPELLTTEDYDLILRLSMTGDFKYVPEATLIYRTHESSLTVSKHHYFAHDFSYLTKKYKDELPGPMLRDLARQYLMAVRLDLASAGYRAFPFLRLGLSLRQMLISIVFLLFPGRDIWALKSRLRKPLEIMDSLLKRFGKNRA